MKVHKNIRIDEQDVKNIESLARKNNLTFSQQLRHILNEYFKRNWYKSIFKNQK